MMMRTDDEDQLVDQQRAGVFNWDIFQYGDVPCKAQRKWRDESVTLEATSDIAVVCLGVGPEKRKCTEILV